jgi:hypothetical protein
VAATLSEASTLRLAAAFSFLSPLAILAGIPFAAGLGVASSILALGSGTLAFAFPGIALLGIGVPVGIVLLLVCIAAL